MISGPSVSYPTRERFRAMTATLREHGLPVRPEFQIGGRGSEEFAARSLSFILEQPEPPSAVIVGNGNAAALAGVLHELRARGVRIGVDLALAVGEDSPLAALHAPAITAVERDVIDIGRRAASMVLSKLATKSKQSRTVVLPTRLVVRASTDWTFVPS
jgi:LacI family transcriptional regulator